MIMLHGRGGAPEDMAGLADHLALPDIAIRAPQAAGNSWWPGSFLAPLAANEPGLSSALGVVEAIAGDLAKDGFGPERTVILGFSQGACLALEYAARAGTPFACAAGLSGGLVGTGDGGGAPQSELYDHIEKTFDYDGRLDSTPVLLGCHKQDPHIPLARVRTSEKVFRNLGAKVTTRIMFKESSWAPDARGCSPAKAVRLDPKVHKKPADHHCLQSNRGIAHSYLALNL